MIENVRFIDKDFEKIMNTELHYITEANDGNLLGILANGIYFKPGINILIGENGCGKTTVMNIIRTVNCIRHSFKPEIISRGINGGISPHFEYSQSVKPVMDCFEVIGDYSKPVWNLYQMSLDVHNASSHADRNVSSLTQWMDLSSRSKGQNLKGDINQLWHACFEETSEPVPNLFNSLKGNDEYTDLFDYYRRNSVYSNEYTIIMDEPDAGLDIQGLKEVYGVLSYKKENTQLITAVHNPVLIHKLSKLDYVNIIELTPGYMAEVLGFVKE